MKALTLLPPWGFCVCFLGKDVENRGWMPSPKQLKVGERFAIHGGKRHKPLWNIIQEVFAVAKRTGVEIDSANMFMNEGILATVILDRIINPDIGDCDSPWWDGGIGWGLRDLIVLPEPIQIGGKQGLWTVPKEIEDRINAQLEKR